MLLYYLIFTIKIKIIVKNIRFVNKNDYTIKILYLQVLNFNKILIISSSIPNFDDLCESTLWWCYVSWWRSWVFKFTNCIYV